MDGGNQEQAHREQVCWMPQVRLCGGSDSLHRMNIEFFQVRLTRSVPVRPGRQHEERLTARIIAIAGCETLLRTCKNDRLLL